MVAAVPIDLSDGFKLDPSYARSLGESLSGTYCSALPYPHIAIDNFLPEDLIKGLADHFPERRHATDTLIDTGYSGTRKRQILPTECDAFSRRAFDFFNSHAFIEYLAGVSGIDSLLPDPYFNGGGFHEYGNEGRLGIHADFRINKRLNIVRRINVIIFLNEHWLDNYKGALELWERDMSRKARSYMPIWNRCVIFNTDATAYHGLPEPLALPEGITRRSIALYYYTASEAIYDEVPNRSTMYVSRSNDLSEDKWQAFGLRMREHANEWVPPAVLRLCRRSIKALRRQKSQSRGGSRP